MTWLTPLLLIVGVSHATAMCDIGHVQAMSYTEAYYRCAEQMVPPKTPFERSVLAVKVWELYNLEVGGAIAPLMECIRNFNKQVSGNECPTHLLLFQFKTEELQLALTNELPGAMSYFESHKKAMPPDRQALIADSLKSLDYVRTTVAQFRSDLTEIYTTARDLYFEREAKVQANLVIRPIIEQAQRKYLQDIEEAMKTLRM